MAIKIPTHRQTGTTAEIIRDEIEFGAMVFEAAEASTYWRKRRKEAAVASTIRACNRSLGTSGAFKNGCLYREKGLNEFWKRGDKPVVLDHAVPVAELVRRHLEGKESLITLIFSPVVRIKRSSNDLLTKRKLAKSGGIAGFPLSRYSECGISIVTHNGDEVNPSDWSNKDHLNLLANTEELTSTLEALEYVIT